MCAMCVLSAVSSDEVWNLRPSLFPSVLPCWVSAGTRPVLLIHSLNLHSAPCCWFAASPLKWSSSLPVCCGGFCMTKLLFLLLRRKKAREREIVSDRRQLTRFLLNHKIFPRAPQNIRNQQFALLFCVFMTCRVSWGECVGVTDSLTTGHTCSSGYQSTLKVTQLSVWRTVLCWFWPN